MDLTPKTLYILKSVDNNITGLESFKDSQSKNTFLIIVPASVNFANNFNLLTQVKEIQRPHIGMKIGLFFSHIPSSDDLQDLFEWCWKQGIINIFAAFYSGSGTQSLLNIFNHNPFGKFDVINRTASGTALHDFFLKQNSNFQHHPLRFETAVSKESIWNMVLRVTNASYEEFYDPRLESIDVLNAEDSFDIYEVRTLLEDQRINMNPWQIISNVVLVPEAIPYPEMTGYLRTIYCRRIFSA